MYENISVIVPPVVCHNLDPHTGIPFMPHMAAHMAGALHEAGYNVQVIDAFGIQPFKVTVLDEFMLMGEDDHWIVDHIQENTKVVYIYCRTMAEFIAIKSISLLIKRKLPNVKIALFENIQSVTSFSLSEISEELLGSGCDVLVLGEPEVRAESLTKALISDKNLNHIDGLIYISSNGIKKTKPEKVNKKLDDLPFPLWERFPLTGYWEAGFAHAPNTNYKFLPILTSRGCPYRCTFCISPSLNPTWRGRSGKSVADEMEFFYKILGITEFHVSDLDPTVNDKRTREICECLIEKDLPITWKLAQGTKIETIKSFETLELMKKAGVTFVAFSPESGSSKMLKIMNKPFNHEHGLRMVKRMDQLGITTQACFIGGVPGEDDDDRKLSISYLKQLMRSGLDEAALYIFAPIPGAELSKSMSGYDTFSQCTFSPTWRKDYREINRFRFQMYKTYFSYLILRPDKLLKRIFGFISGSHKTKMEMSVKKQIKLWILRFIPFAFKKLDAEEELNKAMERQIVSTRRCEYFANKKINVA